MVFDCRKLVSIRAIALSMCYYGILIFRYQLIFCIEPWREPGTGQIFVRWISIKLTQILHRQQLNENYGHVLLFSCSRRKLPGEWILCWVPFTYDMHQKNLLLVTSILELRPECLNLNSDMWYRLPWHSNAFYNTNW